MKSHISLITLAVEALKPSVAFYRDLKLVLWPRKRLAHDTGPPTGKKGDKP